MIKEKNKLVKMNHSINQLKVSYKFTSFIKGWT